MNCVICFSYLYPNGQDFNPHLKAEVDDVEKVVVTEEEQEIYHMMDSTYEECKLCYERPKDSRIEPCGHLICRQCLEQIRVRFKSFNFDNSGSFSNFL